MANNKEAYWSKFARTFDEDQKYIVGEDIQRVLVGKLSAEQDLGEVVEFGCGNGYYTGALANNSKSVIATDFSDEMLEITRTQLKEFQNITVQKADCENTTFPAETFDTVVMINVIHVIENPLNSLQESHRILKRGGVILLANYTVHTMKLFENIKLSIRFLKKWGKPLSYFKGNLSPDQLSDLLQKTGFVIEEAQLVGDTAKALYLKARKK